MKSAARLVASLALTAAAFVSVPASAATVVYDFAGSYGSPAFTYGSGVAGVSSVAFTQSYAGGCFGAAALACTTVAGSGDLPGVGVNTGTAPVTYYTNTLNAGTLFIQPGPATTGDDAIVTFTAQFTGVYTISALLSRIDTTSNGDGVTLSAFGTGLPITTYYLANTVGNAATYNNVVNLQQGDVFSFGVNNAGTYFYDGTGISGTITGVSAVPEAATWAMMLAGFAMIGFAVRRRPSIKTAVTYA